MSSRYPCLIAAGLCSLAVACAQPTPPPGSPASPAPPPPAMAGECDASRIQDLVGRPFSDALLEQARTRAGARVARTLRPGQAITMEFSSQRLNLELDADGKVARARCG